MSEADAVRTPHCRKKRTIRKEEGREGGRKDVDQKRISRYLSKIQLVDLARSPERKSVSVKSRKLLLPSLISVPLIAEVFQSLRNRSRMLQKTYFFLLR